MHLGRGSGGLVSGSCLTEPSNLEQEGIRRAYSPKFSSIEEWDLTLDIVVFPNISRVGSGRGGDIFMRRFVRFRPLKRRSYDKWYSHVRSAAAR